ncbi:response regulator transcription factor [Pseudobacteroides cellulosolvens]|uniref:Stage 0 sporulation protein A homolog n=1 Tax=Pseudobacteroides cellulosolvens ATCC 35603 = DSM 2933 TaxID=398512 RepID=A0A0L6JMS9_9FIRM|nr:response regulator transcription factor [Pseudobacteroides cellulosolvens]KNY27070.1 two component transcriptional regulator, winged helix family [Pseudobacteroides cellulosolvens ATCC 35603 = DSM 2933]
MAKVLIVEDEADIREFLVINLKRAGFDSTEAGKGMESIEMIQSGLSYDIILLDVMLPDINGFTVLKRMRELEVSAGIIMLTARSQEIDKVHGLTLGADDYVVKPFSPSELIARIDALLRRINNNIHSPQKILSSDGFKLDLETRRFYKKDIEIELTQVEFSIIKLFLENHHKALGRDEILNKVWGKNFFGDWKTVDVNISRLRKKVENNPSNPEFINTIHGFGYRWGKG